MVWMWTGFAMVIISAALKGIDPELLEAARVDGANEWQVFRKVTFPLLGPTLAVVSTTMVITSLKTFDIVYTLTNGNYDTDVIANLMVKQMFVFGDFGRASAVAVVLLLAIVPIMAFNIRQFRAQESVR
jgi:alpha-glucoside transport system permease protein